MKFLSSNGILTTPLGWCAAICALVTSCSNSTKTYTWKEEVLLENGKVIVAKHVDSYWTKGGFGEHNNRIEATFSIPMPNTIVWEGHLRPTALDMNTNGEIYLVGRPLNRDDMREYSHSGYIEHVAFRYVANANKWEQIPVESVPHEINPNLLFDFNVITRGYGTEKILTLASKQEFVSEPIPGHGVSRTWRKTK